MDSATTKEIETVIKELVAEIDPNARYLPKYGGEVIATDPNNDKVFVGGIFAYTDHVSLEFSEGASFDDPNKMLEGKGKKRRHLKFTTVTDVADRNTKSFLAQALA